MNTEIQKVAIHTVPYVTNAGHVCSNWCELIVVVGANPVGPKGGHCGKYEDGREIARYSYKDREHARARVKAMVETGKYAQV